MASINELVYTKEETQEQIKTLNEQIKADLRQIWGLEAEIKYQKKWMSIDANKQSMVNGEEVPTAKYVDLLTKTCNSMKGKIVSTRDLVKELELSLKK